jgi:hypothetical protein
LLQSESGSFGGAGAIFGAGKLGLGGGVRNPIYLLTASLLKTGDGSTTPPTRSVLSSSAVQSAFQTLQTDMNDDVTVGARPSHASVGQLQDDLLAIHKGTLTGSAATSAIQADEAAILTSLGLSTSQVSQIQSDLQSVESAFQSESGSGSSTATTTGSGTATTGSGTATTAGGATSSLSGTDPASTSPAAGSTSATPMDPSAPSSAVTSAYQTLQSDLKSDLPSDSQPTNASIGQVLDDLDAIQKGALTGSEAVSAIEGDTASVFTSAGLNKAQITQIQSDQTALATAIQSNASQTSGSTSSATSSSASPTSIAAVEATMQSVQPYLAGVPGIGAPDPGAFGGQSMGGIGGTGGVGPIGQGVNGPIVMRLNDPGGPGMVGPIGLGVGSPIASGGSGRFVYRLNDSAVATNVGWVGDGSGGSAGSGAVATANAVPVGPDGAGAAGQGTDGPVVLSVNGASGAGAASSVAPTSANVSH